MEEGGRDTDVIDVGEGDREGEFPADKAPEVPLFLARPVAAQVAPEQGWDLPETLRHLSLKAGLAPNAWKDQGTEFSVFIAEVFHEE